MTSFAVDVYQNEFLPVDGIEVNAIVTVTATGDGPHGGADGDERGGARGRAPAAEIVIVDTSGSMQVPRTKINAARDAASAAIDCIRDGVQFAVIAGTDTARVVYPRGAFLATADATTREQATWAASRLQADGGTAIGTWLALARELFATVPGRTCHAILLTDGENEHETAE
jgi:Mg-chelatase subunit ChlD